LPEPAEVIEYDWGRNAQQQLLDRRDLLALHVDLNVPPEIVHPKHCERYNIVFKPPIHDRPLRDAPRGGSPHS
jgi:hypothetical protein